MEWQIFMTFAFTRRDVVIVPWRSDGGGGGGGGGGEGESRAHGF